MTAHLTQNSCFACSLNNLPASSDIFELHITVNQNVDLMAFKAFCYQAGIKALVIDLGANVPAQPMTCSRITGSFSQAMLEANQLRDVLKNAGFEVTRVKLEAAPWNAGVPESDVQAQQAPSGNYFEHHTKLKLPKTANLRLLEMLCETNNAHLSRNAFKIFADGTSERLITQRHYGLGFSSATLRFNAFLEVLKSFDFKVEKTVSEYCVFDSNLELDAGWGSPHAA
jgi:hypothetical protein